MIQELIICITSIKSGNADFINYKNDLDGFVEIFPTTESETSIYKSIIRRKGRFEIGYMSFDPPFGSGGVTLKMYEDLYKYHDNRFIWKHRDGTPHGTLIDSVKFPVPGQWSMDDGSTINATKVYSSSNYSKLWKTTMETYILLQMIFPIWIEKMKHTSPK